jgi:hypothetical protein
MKKIMAVFVVLLLGSAVGISTADAAFSLGNLGEAASKATEAAQPRSKDVPTQAQANSDADYVKVERLYYKKSSLKVISKDPNKSKIQVTVYEFVGGRVMVTNYLFECVQNSSKNRQMFETFLGAKTYDEKTGKLTSETRAGERTGSTKTFDVGKLSGILYKQATGKNPPDVY